VRTNGAKIPRSPFGRSRVMLRTAKSCGPGRRCYGQALRRWIGARPGLGASSIRKATVTKRNSSPGRARHKRQPTAQGRPSDWLHLYAAVRFFLRVLSRSGPRVPAGTRSSLRSLHRGGLRKKAKLGRLMPRECCFMRDLTQGMVLPDRIELSTSPLPMECSTTELRQHVLGSRIGRHEGPTKRADICHKPPSCASLLAPPKR
jgi:hypothetical protein